MNDARKAWKHAVHKLQQIIKQTEEQLELGFDETTLAKRNGQAASPASTAEDIGGKKPITVLVAKALKAEMGSAYRDGHGITELVAEKLETAAQGKTIAALEMFMRSDAWWHKKVERFGDEGVNKLTDALCLFRSKFPIPAEKTDDKANPQAPAESNATAKIAESNGKSVLSPLTDAFTSGQEAFRSGKQLKHNPHPSATPLALRWVEGFEAERDAKSGKSALSDADKDKLRKASEKATAAPAKA